MMLGDKLKELREGLGLSHVELAERIGRSKVAIYSYERGSSVPSFGCLVVLAKALRVPLSEFDAVSLPEDRRKPRKRKV